MNKVSVMLKRYLQGLLHYFDNRVSSATAERFNSRIQAIKTAARGFRKSEDYRVRILFYPGRVDLFPKLIH